jgi:DNA-directed RNA polymerase specialized sigma24 family protein
VLRRDEQLLRRFVACRDAGDTAGARERWMELVTDNLGRVEAMVALWARGGRLSPDEREEALQAALIKLWRNMVTTFAGTSMGEWVNAVKACVDFACRDVQRAAARRSSREAPLEDSEAAAPREFRAAHEEHRREAERADARGFVIWGLEQVGNERRRLVLERTLDGVPAEEIAAELDVTLDNLYQLRSRGLRDLARLKERYES